MPAATQAVPGDGRIHSTVYHKRDRRVNDIVRRCRKSDIISLYDIDCDMLFRVEQAHVEFDMMQNYRPYLQLDGKAEGVFLPAKTGLLFPNACDQLDFRTDYEVPASVTYLLSDLEIATLANNGLFNNDWSCQGRVIGSILEIPCKADYSAIANTPITFIEIQDRLSMQTSTMKTGYRTLVAAFLPYQSQKHNEEQHARLREGAQYDRKSSEIRKRALYDTRPIRFADSGGRTMAEGASFVEVAQNRIKQRLHDQMEKANVLGSPLKTPDDVSKQVADTVESIRKQTDASRRQEQKGAEESGHRVQAAVLDARLNDMAQRMVYAGAEAIPVNKPKLNVEPLTPKEASGPEMTVPVNESPDRKAEVASRIGDLDDRIHGAVKDAERDAAAVTEAVRDVKQNVSRKDRLAQRRAQHAAKARMTQEAMNKAGEDEAAKGLDSRDPDVRVTSVNPVTGARETAVPRKKDLEGDILSGEGVDIDELARTMGLV